MQAPQHSKPGRICRVSPHQKIKFQTNCLSKYNWYGGQCSFEQAVVHGANGFLQGYRLWDAWRVGLSHGVIFLLASPYSLV